MFQKIKKSLHDENIPITWLFRFQCNRYIFAVPGLPNLLIRDLVTLENTISISHSLRPLTAGPIRIAENMESLLTIDYSL